MKIPAIKHLVDTYDHETLHDIQEKLENEILCEQEVQGNDEGEKLTHVLAAIWIKDMMQANGTDFKTELRNFTSRVRTSIS